MNEKADNSPSEIPNATQPCVVSITHRAYDDRGIDMIAALSAVMESSRYSKEELPERGRSAALQWFKSKYLTT